MKQIKKSMLLLMAVVFSSNVWSQTITLEEALVEIEEKCNVAVIYNPKEIDSAMPVRLPEKVAYAKLAIEQMLGEDYQVTQRGVTLTLRYKPIPHPVEKTDVTLADVVEQLPRPHDTIREIHYDMALTYTSPNALPTITLRPISEPQLASVYGQPSEADKEDSSKRKKGDISAWRRSLQKDYSPHRLFLSLTAGFGQTIPANATTVLDLRYAWFFHRNWGVSVGAGVDVFGRPNSNPYYFCMVLPYFPIGIEMEYPMTPQWAIYARANAALEVPLSYFSEIYDENHRPIYLDNNPMLYCSLRGEVGAAFRLKRKSKCSIGVGLYAQSIVNTIYTNLHEKVHPWQVGLCFSLRVNKWKKE